MVLAGNKNYLKNDFLPHLGLPIEKRMLEMRQTVLIRSIYHRSK